MPILVDRLERLAEDKSEVTIGDLLEAFGAQGHAPLLMTVAILMILPIGMIPGIGGGLGLLTAAIGVQMIARREGVWLPGFVRRRSVSARRVNGLSRRMHPVSAFLARHLRERLEWLATGRASMTAIALLLILCGVSLMVIGAVPVSVPLLGLPIATFAIGITARDGAVVAAGYLLLIGAGLAIFALW